MSVAIDPRDFRNALGVFATGVTVVSTMDRENQPRGFTANSFTSVSLDPPLILVCVSKTIGAAQVFRETSRFAVNILAADQQSVSNAFGTPAGGKFNAVSWAPGARTGSPVIDGVAASLECETHDTIEQGDHFLLVGQVTDYRYTTANPLGYCRGTYVTFGLAREALNAVQEPGPVRVGAIVEHDGEIYLEPGTGDEIVLPTALRLGSTDDTGSLLGHLRAVNVPMSLSFIYAVFEDGSRGIHYIFYRAEARRPEPATRDHFVPFAEIPWERLPDDATRTMLRRYVSERQQNLFGVYVGDHQSGVVRAISP